MSAAANGKHEGAEVVVFGYCVRCRARREIVGAIQVLNRRGRPDLKGLCVMCGKSMYRLGGWDSIAVAAQPPRAAENSPSETAAPQTTEAAEAVSSSASPHS